MNRQVNDYQLLEEIGTGGMSCVYRARRLSDGTDVAVKVIRIENVAEEFERRLRREPEIHRGLGHPNIVGLYDWFREGNEFFLVMELVKGRSLAQVIHREGGGALSPERAKHYFLPLLQAVGHLHEHGVIHRDIKPSNILISEDETVKLTDFGIAKFSWQQGGTRTQLGVGTPEYMSPEQARGGTVDHRSDIYSLGITLYETITGRKPFTRAEDTPMAYVEVIREILENPLPDPRVYRPDIPSAMVRLLNRATAKDPVERFQSTAEFLGALQMVAPEEDSAPTVVLPEGAVPKKGTGAAAGPGALSPERGTSPPPTPLPGNRDVPSSSSKPPIPTEAVPAGGGSGKTVLWIVGILLFLSLAGYFGYPWYREYLAAEHPLTEAEAETIASGMAEDYRAYAGSSNVPALLSLYDPRGVDYFRLKGATPVQVEDDLKNFYGEIAETSQFDVEVRKSRVLNDSTIETEWILTYQRTKQDGTLLRGQASNLFTLSRYDGDWLISGQQRKWIRRDNLPPPVIDTTALDTGGGAPTVQLPPTATEMRSTVESFLSMINRGQASDAWERYVSESMKAGGYRDEFLGKFSDQRLMVEDVTVDGTDVVANVAQPPPWSRRYTLRLAIIGENGPKIDRIEVTARD